MIRWLLLVIALFGASPATASDAVFSYISYTGSDPVEHVLPLKAGHYRNPVISGFHPDPSIVRVGSSYFLVNSTFAYYPGLPVYRSSDLVNWHQIGNAIDRPDMFDFSRLGVARGIFAPTIRHHDGLFYIINTCIDCGLNFIITAKDPAGPWSSPMFLPSVDGIDPDLFFDDDGRVWITNNGPPIGRPMYDGHRAIWIQEFDLKSGKLVGPRSVIVNGGVHFDEKPIWTEGPHIFKRDGYYYLLAAEGGTAGNHSETVYRSRSVKGPYVPGPINPILTQRDLDPKRPFPVYATGHADFVETPGGKWWAVFLGTRPYEANLSNLGRETFLLPVDWPKGGWPLILPKGSVVPQRPHGPTVKGDAGSWRDDFLTPTLAPQWLMLGTPKERWFRVAPHALSLVPRAASLGSKANPAFLAIRQRHEDAIVETELLYAPAMEGDRAGLVIFADEYHHYFGGIWQTADGLRLVISKRNGGQDPEDGHIIASVPLLASARVKLKVSTKGPLISFSYALADGTWQLLGKSEDGKILASETSNQFTGVVIGPYASSRR